MGRRFRWIGRRFRLVDADGESEGIYLFSKRDAVAPDPSRRIEGGLLYNKILLLEADHDGVLKPESHPEYGDMYIFNFVLDSLVLCRFVEADDRIPRTQRKDRFVVPDSLRAKKVRCESSTTSGGCRSSCRATTDAVCPFFLAGHRRTEELRKAQLAMQDMYPDPFF